jgi:plasmid stabilization system protein ParE
VPDDAVRELFVKSYRPIYEIRDGGVIILAFLHGARRFPSELA